MRRNLAICLTLVVLTAAVYAAVGWHQFVHYDDETYVFGNENVKRGFTWAAVRWAWTTTCASNWHPLTWMSHLLDCELFDGWAGGHHLTNLALHIANTLLLFGLLRRMTGAVWRSAAVAAVFALHPLHVESAAWVAERKDVLSTLLALLALWAYVRYAERPGWRRYLPVLLLYLLSLLAKPMQVTLPCVLLLLDYWPLARLSIPKSEPSGSGSRREKAAPRPLSRREKARARANSERPPAAGITRVSGIGIVMQLARGNWLLLLEKLPLFALAATSCRVTLWAQQSAMVSYDKFPIANRVGHAMVTYVAYLGKMFAPVDLVPFYPHPGKVETETAIAALGLVLAISAAVLWAARRRPYLAVGWFWYLGTLVPVIGLVQVGSQSMADRYMYWPSIGLLVALVWGAADAAVWLRLPRWGLPALASAALGVCAVLTWQQVGYWSDTITLFQHTLDAVGPNGASYNNIGRAYLDKKQYTEAERWFRKAVGNLPQASLGHANLGKVLALQGRLDEAVREYRTVIRCDSDDPYVYGVLGDVLGRQGKAVEAEPILRKALERGQPSAPIAHHVLGQVLQQQRKIAEALERYEEAVRLAPEMEHVWNSIAWIRATCPDARFRNGRNAVKCAERAMELAPARDANLLSTLAAAYAEDGQIDRAKTTVREAIALARKTHEKQLLAELEKQAAAFAAGHPYRDSELSPSRR
jgi:protein O-mannosyl-transferase